MQKLKIVNSKGENIEFIAEVSKHIFVDIVGLEIPDQLSYKTSSPFLDGNTFHGSVLEERIINFFGRINASSAEEMYRLRKELNSLMKNNIFTLYYFNDYGTYRIFAHLESKIIFSNVIENSVGLEIEFICSDPYLYKETETVRNLKYILGGMSFPVRFPTTFAEVGYEKKVINSGDVDIPLLINYIGAVTNPAIENTTTNKKIKFNMTLDVGDTLIINTEDGKQSCIVVDDEGNETDVFSNLTSDSDFDFSLVVGENKIKFESDSDSSGVLVELHYSEKYVGV